MKKLWWLAALLFAVAASAQPLPPPQGPQDLSLLGPNAAGRFYGPILVGAPTSVALTAANKLYAMPVYIRPGSVLKTLNFDILTGNAAAWNARLCLYADTGQGMPGALVSDAGTVAVGSGSVVGVQTATIAAGGVAVGGAWYWVAFMADNASENIASAANPAGGSFYGSRLMGWSSALAGAIGTLPDLGVSGTQTFGACPGTFPSPAFADNTALPYVVMGY